MSKYNGSVSKNIFGGYMNKFILTGCSTADLQRSDFEDNNIPFVSFHYTMNGVEYEDDLGKTISPNDFYKAIEEGATPSTSQVNSEQYIKFWEPYLQEGLDVLHITLSSGISGTYNSALLAKRYLDEKYPERRLFVIDSLGASSGYGMLLMYANDLKNSGKTIEECRDWLEENKLNVHHWFFSTDLTSYKRGGRISSASFFLGQLLKICPLLNMDNEGRLIPRKKVRTKDKIIIEIVKKMEEHVIDGYNYDGKCYLCHSACEQDALKIVNLLKEKFTNLKGKIRVFNIGAVIGSHTGPGTVALFFLGTKRID